ncbi:MAG: winged helix-turn-helix domain-containing protein [Lentisphaeria bacterium]|nr:winged helix-turn-helix domain-containing protein [Lentisphaeria bacterium]
MKSTLLKDQVYERLCAAFISGHYAPGSRLPPEPDLCQELGVSRGTLRQALSRLAAEGLIERRSRHGTLVLHCQRAKAKKVLFISQASHDFGYYHPTAQGLPALASDYATSNYANILAWRGYAAVKYCTAMKTNQFMCPEKVGYDKEPWYHWYWSQIYGISLGQSFYSYTKMDAGEKSLARLTEWRNPSTKVWAGDTGIGDHNAKQYSIPQNFLMQAGSSTTEGAAWTRHGRTCNVLWMDAHVQGVESPTASPRGVYSTGAPMQANGKAWYRNN